MPHQHLDADARTIVDLANDIAHEFELEFVGTEHILLAILRHNGGIGARVLKKLGVTEKRARQTLDEIIQRAKEDTWVFGRLPGSPNYRRVIEMAIEEAKQLESAKIGSEHLLLGLLREKGTSAEQVLVTLGATLKKCRAEVLHELHSSDE
jgi:ATP-dependent Clp protease ATP-binding subunit ClpC